MHNILSFNNKKIHFTHIRAKPLAGGRIFLEYSMIQGLLISRDIPQKMLLVFLSLDKISGGEESKDVS